MEWIKCIFSRFGTISHILASTDLNCCTKKEDVLSDEALIEKNAVEIVKQMQRLKGIDGDYDSDSAASNRLAQRHTIQVNLARVWKVTNILIISNHLQNLERNRQKKRAIGTLDVAFKKRFFALSGKMLMSYLKDDFSTIKQPGEEDAPGGPADGTPKPHNINREIFFKNISIMWHHTDLCVLDTPILGSRMPMRRETLKAIETARDNLMQVGFWLKIKKIFTK